MLPASTSNTPGTFADVLRKYAANFDVINDNSPLPDLRSEESAMLDIAFEAIRTQLPTARGDILSSSRVNEMNLQEIEFGGSNVVLFEIAKFKTTPAVERTLQIMLHRMGWTVTLPAVEPPRLSVDDFTKRAEWLEKEINLHPWLIEDDSTKRAWKIHPIGTVYIRSRTVQIMTAGLLSLESDPIRELP